MVWTLCINGVSGFIMVITFAFCVGNVEQVLSTSTGFPFIQVFYNATGSKGGTTAMTVIIMAMSICSMISNVATTSRQMYAFARDQALPFSSFLCQVSAFSSSHVACQHLRSIDRARDMLMYSCRSIKGGSFHSTPFASAL